MPGRTETIKTRLANGTIIYVQATILGGEEMVASRSIILDFKEVSEAIESIAESVVGTLQKVKPKRASVEFGLELAVESGKLTALIVNGTGTASLKITLEWGSSEINY